MSQMAEISKERKSSCFYFERYRIINRVAKTLHGPRPFPNENGWDWAIGIEENSDKKYVQPTIVETSDKLLEIRFYDEEAVCLTDKDLRNTDYDAHETNQSCETVLESNGWEISLR
jgi:hypothetical protein